jgi:hypothetical protein
MPKKSGARNINRSAITGRFIKPSTVKNHPKTTITQKVSVPKKKNK